jgi:hypothetical protein
MTCPKCQRDVQQLFTGTYGTVCRECKADLDNIEHPSPVFRNCNVCGRGLARADEFAAGMCAVCANEEIL